MSQIFQNEQLKIEIHPSPIPWLKIFTNHPYKEMSQLPKELRYEIYELLDTIEREMISFYNPTKINIASFGNYLPHLHWHIMARFEDDTHYPEPMWGEQQRDEKPLNIANIDEFITTLLKKIG